MPNLIRRSAAALGAAFLVVGIPTMSRAQEPSTSHAHSAAATLVTRATNPDARAAIAPSSAAHDDIAPVRRQPKHLLDGLVLSRAEKKAVYGIIRRNARTLADLEASSRRNSEPALHASFEREITAVRNRERAELRAVLRPNQRARFDANVARLDDRDR